MVAYAVSVNVFLGGAAFDPPPPLGTIERARYVKLTTLEQAQDRRCARIDKRGARRVGHEGPRDEGLTRPKPERLVESAALEGAPHRRSATGLPGPERSRKGSEPQL